MYHRLRVWEGSEGFVIHKSSKGGEAGVVTILIVLHNSELASEIAEQLATPQRRTLACSSVRSPEFLRELPDAALVITDLAVPVLRVLPVASRTLLEQPVPLVVLASRGHCESFATMLAPHRAICLEHGWGAHFLEALRRVADEHSNGTAFAVVSAAAAARGKPALGVIHTGHTGRRESRDAAAQDRMLGDLAHDLRTPLMAIHDFARLITDGVAGPTTEQQRRYVDIIGRRCREASRMVDNLLDAAKIRSGRIHPHREPVDLAAVLADVRESLDPSIRHKGVRFAVECPTELPAVFADQDMVARALANLVSNALKFTPDGGSVVVRCERDSVSMARVSVIDTGTGISSDEMRRIFRRFEQGANRVASGVGLGLSIVRQLVKLQGGRVTAESTPGRGSRFQFTLPLFLPLAIVRRHLCGRSGSAAPHRTFWGFTCPESARLDAIHRLITATAPACDLVMPCPGTRRILLITRAAEPERLVGRLMRQISARSPLRPALTRLSAEAMKRWLAPADVQPEGSTQPGIIPLAG